MCLFLLIVLSLYFPAFASAQDEQEQPDAGRNRGAQYYLGEQDELLIKVNIWGFVRKPGQYMVPKDTDLISLISFAGGPLEQAKIKKVKIIRSTSSGVSSSHTQDGANHREMMLASRAGSTDLNVMQPQAQQVIEVNIKKYLETGRQTLIPELQPGDTIVVPGNTLQFLGKVIDFASKFAVLAQIYFWVAMAER